MGPGGVGEELVSVTAPKSVRGNWPLWSPEGLPWPPVASRSLKWPPVGDGTDAERRTEHDDGDDGRTQRDGRTDDMYSSKVSDTTCGQIF